MRIATWNLERPRSATSPRALRLLAWMQRIDADIWILTETHEAISPGPNYECASTAAADRIQSAGEQWTMIWSRLPIIDAVPTCDPIRAVCARIAVSETLAWQVYGTVLPWRTDQRWLPKKGGAAFQHALLEQEADWMALRSRFADDRLCIAGDLNQELGTPALAGTALGRNELRRALGATSLTCPTGDADDPIARLTAGARANIDHICLDARYEADAQITTGAWPATPRELSGLTDHFGVWVDVTL